MSTTSDISSKSLSRIVNATRWIVSPLLAALGVFIVGGILAGLADVFRVSAILVTGSLLTVIVAALCLSIIPKFGPRSIFRWPMVAAALTSHAFVLSLTQDVSANRAEVMHIATTVAIGAVWLRAFGGRSWPYTTWTIVVILTVMWLLKETTRQPSESETDALLRFGAAHGHHIAAGEYWRLLTPLFVHIDLAHLLGNGFVIVVLGHATEWARGRGHLIAVFLVSGTVGELSTYLFTSVYWDLVHAGASGSAYGLCGAIVAYCIVEGPRLRQLDLPTRTVLAFIAVALSGGLIADAMGLLGRFELAEGPDVAHVAGFLSGLLLTLVLSGVSHLEIGERLARFGVDVDPSSLSKRWLILPAALIALASAVLLWIDTTPDDYVQLAVEQRSLGNLTEAQQHLDNALREDPEHGPAHMESARVSLAMDDLDAALHSAGAAIGYLEGSDQEEASRLFAQIKCKKGGPWVDAEVCAKYQE